MAYPTIGPKRIVVFTRRSTGLPIARTTSPTFTDDRMRTIRCTERRSRADLQWTINRRRPVIGDVRQDKKDVSVNVKPDVPLTSRLALFQR